MAGAYAVLRMDSDWATFQLATERAAVKPVDGVNYPPDVIFTPKGVLIGQPNQSLLPHPRSIELQIFADDSTITFFTGHGNRGSAGPYGGYITVKLASTPYENNDITGDGLNIKVFYDAPLDEE